MNIDVNSWQFWAFLSAAFAALTAIFAKIGVADVNSDVATFARTLVVIAVLGAILLARGLLTDLRAIGPGTWLFLALSGLATGASWVCYFHALKIGDAARVAPVDKLSVVLVAVFASVFLGERMSAMGWSGVALIAAGAALVALG
jgi:transporter family protein